MNAQQPVRTIENIERPAGVPSRTGAMIHTGHRPVWPALAATPLLLAAFIVALQTQVAVTRGASGGAAAAGFALSIAIFLGGLALTRRSGLLEWREAPPAAASRPAFAGVSGLNPRRATAALVLGGATFLFSGGNAFSVVNLTTWVLSVGLALAACWERRPIAGAARRRTGAPETAWRALASRIAAGMRSSDMRGLVVRVPWHALALAVVLAAGAFFLFYRIGDVPREMTSDHAEKLYDVRDVLDGQHRIFFPRNTGREAFQFYWIALMTPFTGASYLTMKIGTALLAFGALPFTYLLARTLFDPRVALLTAGVLASTRWLWQVARVGLRFPFPPLFGAAVFYFLLKAIRDRRRNDFLLCGLALGVAQHTYTALRLAPLGVVACVAVAAADDLWRRRSRERARELVINTGLLVVVALLVFMPLARYAFDEPQMFLFRGVTRMASDSADRPPADALGVFLLNIKNALLMFNWRGDVVWVNTIPSERALDPISGVLFVLGCTYALYRLIRYRELPYLYLFILLFVGLLPSMLTVAFPQENPSTVRMGMAIPITAIFVASPLALLVRRLRAWVGGEVAPWIAGLALAALLLAVVRINFDQYFRIYPAQHSRSSQHTWYAAQAIKGFIMLGGRQEDVYILPGPHWMDWRLVAIEVGDVRWTPILRGYEDARQHDGTPRERLYVVHPDDRTALQTYARWYPQAIVHVHTLEDTGNQPWFVTVLVPAGAVASG